VADFSFYIEFEGYKQMNEQYSFPVYLGENR